jgi:beta-xylosidase
MKDSGSIGCMTYISPIFWEDDWPVWGTDAAQDQVPATATKPIQGKPLMQPATSDDFSSSTARASPVQ